MGREIKFRAWDKKTNRMLNHNYLLNYSFKNVVKAYGETGRLMQFTGLRDSKRTEEFPEGQEIYEGDIVRTLLPMRGEVKYGPFNDSDCIYPDCGCTEYRFHGWYIQTEKEGQLGLDSGVSDWGEVIGNVWENPELLEDKA